MAQQMEYRWESPDGKVAISLPLAVAGLINAAIAEAAAAAPVRDAEIGGLLLGRAERDSKLNVWIEGVEFLPSRYPRGPSFHLDPQDAPDMTRPGIVGCFRSHTRKDLFLSEYDQALLQELLPSPDSIFLLVKPFKTRASVAGFFYREGDRIDAAASVREFPFPGGEPAAVPQQDGYPNMRPPRRRGPPAWMWAAFGSIALLAVGVLAYLLWNRPAPPTVTARAPAASLGLTATEGEHEITLKWNRPAAAVQTAPRAVVEIQEGTFHKLLTMDAEQLQYGSLVYSRPLAIADTVFFRMKLFSGREPPVVELVELVSSRPVEQAPVEPQPEKPQARPAKRTAILPKAPATPVAADPAALPVPTLVRPAPRRIP